MQKCPSYLGQVENVHTNNLKKNNNFTKYCILMSILTGHFNDGIGCDGMVPDRMGWDLMVLDGIGWDWKGWDRI